MAELSKETEAIIDRLKREGQLTRNGDANSIKQVKINLEKFAPVFQNINTSLININSTIDKFLGRAEAYTVERVNTGPQATGLMSSEQLDELTRSISVDPETAELQKQAAELALRNNIADEERRGDEERKRKEKEEDDRKRENLQNLRENTITGQMVTNPLGFFGKVLKGALVGFVGFNIVRGVIDQFMDGAATKALKSIDWKGIADGFTNVNNLLGMAPWKAFAGAITAWAMIDVGAPLAIAATGEFLRTNMLTRTLSNMQITNSTPGMSGLGSGLSKGVIAAAGVAVGLTMMALRSYIDKNSGLTEQEIATRDMTFWSAGTAMDVVGYGATGATFGAMFGPQGAAVGAIVGTMYGIGMKAVDALMRTAEQDIDVARLDEDIADRKAKAAQAILEGDLTGYTDVQIAQFEKQAAGPTAEEIGDTNEQIARSRLETKDDLALAREQLANKDYSRGAKYNVRFEDGVEVYDQIMFDADKSEENRKALVQKIADLEKSQTSIESQIAARIEAGRGTDNDFIFLTPEGFAEAARDFWQSSGDRRVARIEEFEKFLADSAEDDNVSKENLDRLVEAISKGAITGSQAIQVIVGGAESKQYVDSSDKSAKSMTINKYIVDNLGALPTG